MLRYLAIALLLTGLLPVGVSAQVAEPSSFIRIHAESDHTNQAYARAGSVITVYIDTDNPIELPSVSVNGTAAAVEAQSAVSYTATYTVPSTDPEGPIALSITATDMTAASLSASAVTEGASVTIDLTAPYFMTPIPTPSNVALEATDPGGTQVTFGIPMGEDGPMNALEATCTPHSGTLYPIGSTPVTCTMVDMAGNASAETVSFSVEIIDTTAPVLSVTGDSPMTVTAGSTFTDPGFTATDNGSLTLTLMTAGAVDTATLGTYTLTYTATDEAGNAASVTREVTVVEAPRSGGGGGGGSSRRTVEEDTTAAEPEGEVLGESTETLPEGEVLGASAYSFTRYLKQGDTGDDVLELQKLLGVLGYFTHPATGYFGPLTAAALRAYQGAHGLETVGYVGPRTLALLNTGTVATDPRITTLVAEIARLKAEIAILTKN